MLFSKRLHNKQSLFRCILRISAIFNTSKLFSTAIVDERDSLYNALRKKKAEWLGKVVDEAEKRKREEETAKVMYSVVNGLMYLYERDKAKQLMLTLSSHDVFYGPDRVIVLGLHPMGSKLPGIGAKAWDERGSDEDTRRR